MRYPYLSTRLKSTLIDSVVVVIGGMYLASTIFERLGEVPDSWRIATLFGLFFIYEPLSQTLGCSLGNYMMGIRVRSATDESRRINFFRAMLRLAVKLSLGWVSFVTIHSNPKRQALHDIAAGSVMVAV